MYVVCTYVESLRCDVSLSHIVTLDSAIADGFHLLFSHNPLPMGVAHCGGVRNNEIRSTWWDSTSGGRRSP